MPITCILRSDSLHLAPRHIVLFTLLCFSLVALTIGASAQSPQWSFAMAAGGASGHAFGSGLAVDDDGNTYVAITFSDTIHLGSVSLRARSLNDIVVAKLDRSGSVIWWEVIDGDGDERGFGLARGQDGSVFVAMNFRGTARLGSTSIKSRGSSDEVAVACYTSNGTLRWATTPITGGAYDVMNMEAARDGGCILLGKFRDSIMIGSIRLVSAGGYDAYVARLDAKGDPFWARAIGGPGMDDPVDLSVGATGKTAVVGSFGSSISLAAITVTTPSENDRAIFIAVIDSDGRPRYLKSDGGTGGSYPRGVAMAGDESVYMVGTYTGSTRVGDRDLPASQPEATFLAAYDAELTPRWVWPTAEKAVGFLEDVVVAPGREVGEGGVYVTGAFGEFEFGGIEPESYGPDDLLVARFDDDGMVRWIRTGGSISVDYGTIIRSGADGSCRVLGRVEPYESASATFGPFTLHPATDGNVFIGSIEQPAGAAAPGYPAVGTPARSMEITPNPAAGFAALSLDASHDGPTRVEVIDALGRLRAVPFDGRLEERRSVEIRTDGLDEGIYFCRVVAGGKVTMLPMAVRR